MTGLEMSHRRTVLSAEEVMKWPMDSDTLMLVTLQDCDGMMREVWGVGREEKRMNERRERED